MRHTLRRLITSPLLLFVGIGLGACGGDESGSAADGGMAMEEAQSSADYAADMDRRGIATPPPAPAPMAPDRAPHPLEGQSDPDAAPRDTLPARMMIRTGFVRVEVEQLDPAVEAVQALATRLDGFVVDIAMEVGRDQVRSATLTVRIPAPRFDEALQALEPLGELESVRVQAQDVGEEYADLEARNRNAERLEQRLLELLANRTGSLEDVLAVERELARVRSQIERHEGRMRYLRNRVALSTLTLTLHEPEPLFSERPGQNVLTTSIRQAGRNFMALLGGLIASLGFVVPLLVLLAVVWWLVRRRRSRRGIDTPTNTSPGV